MIQTAVTGIGDPFVLLCKDTYYMYATSGTDGFYVWTSSDLEKWEKRGFCYEKGERSFGYTDFWAPEVVEKDGKFIMHYTARSKEKGRLLIGVAVADSPLGPFTDVKAGEPMFDLGYATIDGHVFRDDDGKNYFFYSKDCSENVIDGIHTSQIYMLEMTDDLLGVKGEPVFISTPDQKWETSVSDTWRWNEGPFVVKKEGKYYLTYSGNCFDNKYYGVGFAIADNVYGPYVKSDSNPVLSYKENVYSGPGHHCFFYDKEGNLKTAFHIHTDYEHPSGDRRACIADAKIGGGKVIFEC